MNPFTIDYSQFTFQAAKIRISLCRLIDLLLCIHKND